MLSILEKLRTWGIKGAIDYLRGQYRRRQELAYFEHNARKYPLTPGHGITVIAPFGDTNSYSKVPQDLIVRLNASGIPFQTFNMSDSTDSADADVKALLTPKKDFRVLKYSCIVGSFPPGFLANFPQLSKYQLFFWEFESGLVEQDSSLCQAPGMLAMSDFNRDIFTKLLPSSVPVHKVLYPFRLIDFNLTDRNTTRAKYGCSADDFVVFYNFSLRSSYYRKNPDGALKAFAEAFRDTPNAKLVFKVSGAKSNPDKVELLNSLAADLGVADRLIMVSDFLSTPEIYSLTAASDIYLSLHRGEGFGLGIAEAMSLGVPPVITAYSAPLEFCNESNSMLIPYAMRKVEPNEIDNKSYRFVKEWAEADIHEAAKALKQLYSEPKKREQLGNAAKASICAKFSTENFKASIEAFLRQQ